jgi:hypothetical protein
MNSPHSRVHVFRDLIPTAREVFKIWKRSRFWQRRRRIRPADAIFEAPLLQPLEKEEFGE